MPTSLSSQPEPQLDGSPWIEMAEDRGNEADAERSEHLASSNNAWSEDVVRSNFSMHAIFFLLASAVILMSFLMRSDGPTQVFLPWSSVPLPDSCASRRISGLDCPGCGLTRAFISISHGQLWRAWGFNAASFVMYPFVAVQIPWNALQMYMLKRRRRSIQLPFLYLLPIVISAILCMHWFWRLSIQMEIF